MVCLAGPIAQVLYSPRSFRNHHAGFDWKSAVEVSMMCTHSASTTNLHLDYLDALTRDRLKNPQVWKLVTNIACALLARTTLDGKEIAAICFEVE